MQEVSLRTQSSGKVIDSRLQIAVSIGTPDAEAHKVQASARQAEVQVGHQGRAFSPQIEMPFCLSSCYSSYSPFLTKAFPHFREAMKMLVFQHVL